MIDHVIVRMPAIRLNWHTNHIQESTIEAFPQSELLLFGIILFNKYVLFERYSPKNLYILEYQLLIGIIALVYFRKSLKKKKTCVISSEFEIFCHRKKRHRKTLIATHFLRLLKVDALMHLRTVIRCITKKIKRTTVKIYL